MDEPGEWAWLGGGVALLAILIVLFLRRRKRPAPAPTLPKIDLAEHRDGPLPDFPRLECYNVPVRLAVLVFAPVGRGGVLPLDDEGLLALADQVAPHLADVARAHRPYLVRWPAQLSPRGFANAFFAKAPLPGARGRGTPWCSVAGKFEAGRHVYMAGLAMVSAESNSLSQFTVERPSDWFGILRIRREA